MNPTIATSHPPLATPAFDPAGPRTLDDLASLETVPSVLIAVHFQRRISVRMERADDVP